MTTKAPGNEPAELGAWLRTAHLGRDSTYHEVIGSTQDEARDLAAGGAPHGLVVWAGSQTGGRGRMERRWVSPPAGGLWFSVVLRPGVEAGAMAGLALAMGAAVASALDAEAPDRVRLKWPNDVLADGRKLAGILVEGLVAGGVLNHAVVGVGVNLAVPAGGFDPEISSRAIALAQVTGREIAPVRLLAAILGTLEAAYVELLARGPAAARSRWLELSDTVGRDVVARAGGEEVRGRAVDLDAEGGLVLATSNGPRTITFGEIEHLR